MNIKRYIISSIVVAAFVFVYDWIFHGMCMKDIYMATAYLWRPKEVMMQYMPWMTLGQVSFAFIFSYIFLKGYENKGIMEGVRYGLLIGLLFVPATLIDYAVLPYPPKLIIYWDIGTFIELSLAGVILAKVYRP